MAVALLAIVAAIVAAAKKWMGSRTSRESGVRVLAAVNRGDDVERIVSLACKIAASPSSRVQSLCVLEVPLSLPVNADVPQLTGVAANVLERAAQIASAMGVDYSSSVRKARFAGKVIVDLANEERADVVVLGSGSRFGSFSTTADYVSRNAACEVIVSKA